MLLIIFAIFWRRIPVTIRIVAEASKFLGDVPSLIYFPFAKILALIALVCWLVYITK